MNVETVSQTLNKLGKKLISEEAIRVYCADDLCLKENCCTDALQTELNNGWRIIAVCVQPNQRRPDYVLGRYNPELEVTNKDSAER